MKRCSNCRQDKPLDHFYAKPDNADGLYKQCKRCHLVKTALSCSRRSRETRRRYNLANKYGLTPGQFDEMVLRQGGRCLVCGRPGTMLCVDHDHNTGRVRGLLCRDCNAALGLIREDHRTALKLAYYIEDRCH